MRAYLAEEAHSQSIRAEIDEGRGDWRVRLDGQLVVAAREG